EPARRLFALRQAPAGLARSLLAEVVDADARLSWRGDSVALAAPPEDGLALEAATYVVVDLEPTGLRPGSSQICEIGAVRIRELEVEAEFQTLVDPVGLARRLLAGRVPRASLAQLAYFLGTEVQPCHRALPDAQATAEVLLALIGLAQERGARTVADLVSLAATRTRRVWDKRHL